MWNLGGEYVELAVVKYSARNNKITADEVSVDLF
jgi:hypothetical protein